MASLGTNAIGTAELATADVRRGSRWIITLSGIFTKASVYMSGTTSGTPSATPPSMRSGFATANGSLTATLAYSGITGLASGDLLIAAVTLADNTGVLTPPTGWTVRQSVPDTAGGTQILYLLTKVYAGETNTVFNWTNPDSANQVGAGIISAVAAFHASGSPVPSVTAGAPTGAGPALATPSVTPTNPCIVISAFGQDQNGTSSSYSPTSASSGNTLTELVDQFELGTVATTWMGYETQATGHVTVHTATYTGNGTTTRPASSAILAITGPSTGGGGSQAHRVAIYTDQSTTTTASPSTLIAASSEVVVPASVAAGWVDFPLYAYFSPGYYNIQLISGPTTNATNIYFDSQASKRYTIADTYSDGPASTAGAMTVGTGEMSINATYTAITPVPTRILSTAKRVKRRNPSPVVTASITGGGGGGGTVWKNGIGTFRESSYTQVAAYANLDLLMTDLNGTVAPSQFPSIRTQFYRSICSCNQAYENSIPWATANANGWLLRDSSGALIYNGGFSTNNILDISNPAVSTALANQVISRANQYGYKGIWFDDGVANGTSLVNALPSGWTQTMWYSNMVAHIQRTCSAIRATGLEAVINANGRIPGDNASDTGDKDLTFWADIIAGTGGPTGLTHEYWMQNPISTTQVLTLGAAWYQHWDGWRRLHPFCNTNNIDFIPLSYMPGGTAEVNYLRGTFLLDYTGGNSAFLIGNNDTTVPAFTALGSATGAAVESPSGVWTRAFQNGTVVVNANAGTATIG